MRNRRPASGRVPKNVPQHPKALALVIVIGAGGLILMVAWFWLITSGGGILLTEEEQTASANAELEITPGEVEELPSTGAESADVNTDIPDEPVAPPTESSSQIQPPATAPGTSSTLTEEWEFTGWSILSRSNKLMVSGDLRNISGDTQSGELVLFVYNEDTLLSRATLNVVDFPHEATERVEFLGADDWEPGNKILILAYAPEE